MNWLFIILLVALGIFLIFQKKKGKSWKSILGFVLIALGIIFIEPLPDPITMGVYGITHGVSFSSITLENVSNMLWQFEMWAIGVGIILLIIGAMILGWDFKKLWRKLNLERYWIAFFLSILVVILVAWIDVQGMIYLGSFSSMQFLEGHQASFWSFFQSIVFVIFIILPFAYYFLYKKDKSEAISLFISSWVLWMFGFADIMFFVLSGTPIPQTLTWLNTHPVIGTISSVLGYEGVNSASLLFSTLVGFILAYFSAKILKDKF